MRSVKSSCRVLKVRTSGADVMVDFDPFYEETIETNLDKVSEWSCSLPECIQTDEEISEKLRTSIGYRGLIRKMRFNMM
ncbi:MAG: hypothetical protein ACI80P_001762 [Flavobacteriales bacterium]